MKSIHVISLGFCAVFAQAVFVREMLVLFTGTELVLGVLLAGWLFWIGLGGLLGDRVIRSPGGPAPRTFERLAVAIALLCPATTIALRLGRVVLAQPPGSIPPFLPAVAFSLVVMAPYGFLYGAAYNVASGLAARGRNALRGGITLVYVWEAFGSLAGALAFYVLLAARFSQLETTLIVSFVLFAVTLLVSADGRDRRARLAIVTVLGFAFLLLGPVLDRSSIEAVYPGYRVERFLSSRYGELVAASRDEVLSFFSGGGRLFSVPEPERAEENVHIPLLAHPAPRRVLLIGGSLGGGWEEAVKHPTIESVDCIELDGALIELYRESDTTLVRGVHGGGMERTPEGVRFITGDGRFHLAAHDHEYDVIIVNAPPPLNLQWNRYYTVEFFRLAKRSLAPGGIFACSHPSSENFLTRRQAVVLRVIRRTMERAFGPVSVLPGSTAHFIYGGGAIDVDQMLTRLAERDLGTLYISADFLPFRFSAERTRQLDTDLEGAGVVEANTDLRPILPIYELLLEGRRVGISGIGLIERMTAIPFFVPPLVITVVFVLIFAGVSSRRAARVSVMTVGFTSLLFQVMILLALQSFSGLLYHAIVLLTALFMAGAGAGAFTVHRLSTAPRAAVRIIHCIFAVLVSSFAVLLGFAGSIDVPAAAGEVIFSFYSAAGGILTGAYYALAVRRSFPKERNAVPALFYAYDLFGACAGGIIGGAVLVPFTGMIGAAALIVAVHLFATVILAGRW